MRARRVLKRIGMGLGVLIALVLVFFALNNLGTPTHSAITERLSEQEKARVSEVVHLRKALGEALWNGWGNADIPLIVYNEEYVFLVGYPNPPPGWQRVPNMRRYGVAWEPVPDDAIDGEPYYRQRLASSEEGPQNFTVLVGSRWVPSVQTKEWAFIALGNSFSENLPAVLRPIFPRGLVAQLFLGDSDKYISLGLHEAFHAYQGMVAPARLAAAEKANKHAQEYPFDNPQLREAWQVEMNWLTQAVRASSDGEAKEFARQFLKQRDARRSTAGLNPALVDYERQREWLEGLAKYTEIEMWRMAAETPNYQPVAALKSDPDFHNYRTFQEHRTQEVSQINLTLGSEEVRFYYAGMAQGFLLDRLMPDWKRTVLSGDVTTEDLLRQATENESVSSERITK